MTRDGTAECIAGSLWLGRCKPAGLDACKSTLTLSLSHLQDEMFNAYAHECLTEYASQGKTTVPMQILLNKRPTLDLLL